MIASKHLRECVIRPALDELGLYTLGREELLVVTAAQESLGGTWLMQNDSRGYPKGPALGIYQEEPATYHDCFENFLRYNPILYEKLTGETFPLGKLAWHDATLLTYDLRYATKAAACQYYRFKEAVPAHYEIDKLVIYYKRYWNTSAGKATLEETKKNYQRYIAQ
jgi:hypothetical protein